LGEVLCRAEVSHSTDSTRHLRILLCLREKRKDPAGIPTSSSKETLTCNLSPVAAVLLHEEYWHNCKKEIMDEVGMLPGFQLLN